MADGYRVRKIGVTSGEYAKHLRPDGKQAFWGKARARKFSTVEALGDFYDEERERFLDFDMCDFDEEAYETAVIDAIMNGTPIPRLE